MSSVTHDAFATLLWLLSHRLVRRKASGWGVGQVEGAKYDVKLPGGSDAAIQAEAVRAEAAHLLAEAWTREAAVTPRPLSRAPWTTPSKSCAIALAVEASLSRS